MKTNKKVDKKLIFLFLIMIIMIVFMFYFLKKQKKQDEELDNVQSNTTIDILTSKQKKINKILNEEGGLFNENIEALFDDLNLKSYVDLPLEVGKVGNPYPFGNPEEDLGNLE